MIPETELAYAAGLFDGEGSVMIRYQYGGRYHGPGRSRSRWHSVTVALSNTDARAITWLQERWPGTVNQHVYRNERHNPAWRWVLWPTKAEAFLRDVRPYLVLKAEQADLALALRATVVPRGHRLTAEALAERERITGRLRELNRRGR